MNSLPQVLPRHVGIIMDGNGRWARRQGLPRTEGHSAGARTARDVAQCCVDWGIPVLTLYAFSTENWKRPRAEVHFLMSHLEKFLRKHRDDFAENDIRVRPIGVLDELPEDVRRELQAVTEATAGGEKLTLVLALNYGGRREIVDAARAVARRVRSGELDPDQVDEALLDGHMYTAGLPALDLLVRTGGEMRVSNFLLWQLHYAEFYVTDTFWPDFGKEEFLEALQTYARRERRWGAVPEGRGRQARNDEQTPAAH